MKLCIVAGALFATSTSVVAQVAPVAAPAIVPIAAPASNMAVLRTGTEVPLKLAEMVTTKGKKLKVGQRIHMEVAEPVLVNGVIVVPAGSPAMGEITEVRNKGMWGKSGHFTGRALYTTVNGRQMRLSGGFDDKGTTGTAGVVGAIALIPVAGFFMTGTSAELPIGAPVKAFMDEDVQLAMSAAAAAPLVVGVPTAPAAAPPASTIMVSVPSGATKPVTQPAVLQTIAPAATK
jgi:hypothetical protein